MTIAASASRTRSASTPRISGWSISRFWKALRWAAWWSAWATAWRISAAELSAASSRVWWTILMIARTPWPGSPTSCATAPAYSISAEALDAVAELVLEALDVDGVALPVRPPARHEEAGETRLGLRER